MEHRSLRTKVNTEAWPDGKGAQLRTTLDKLAALGFATSGVTLVVHVEYDPYTQSVSTIDQAIGLLQSLKQPPAPLKPERPLPDSPMARVVCAAVWLVNEQFGVITAEAIYRVLAQYEVTVSAATLSRALNALLEHHLIRRRPKPAGSRSRRHYAVKPEAGPALRRIIHAEPSRLGASDDLDQSGIHKLIQAVPRPS